jgi:hypothetical protein
MECNGFGCVLYCDLESNLRDEKINPEALAEVAIESAYKMPERNAVRYLANNIVQGIITPLTYPYHLALRSKFAGEGKLTSKPLSNNSGLVSTLPVYDILQRQAFQVASQVFTE